eukprot:gene14448-17547_t
MNWVRHWRNTVMGWCEHRIEEVPPGVTCTALMSLRVGMGALIGCGLPALQLRCYAHSRRLLTTLEVVGEACGNGQRLRQHTVSRLVEWVAQQVRGFSRDPGYFSQAAVASDDPEHGLQALASLAYLHRFNLTADLVLQQQAQVPLIERLENSLQTFADRPARFFETPTVRTLATLMGDGAPPEAPTGQATRDALRELHVQTLPAEQAGERRRVIVTGANSFLG